MNIVTLEEYKSYNTLSANPKEDAKISFLITSVSALIQTYLGRDFSSGKSVTEIISLDYDTDTIYLDNYPIESIQSISESDRYTYDSSVHVPLVYASEYRANLAEGILYRQYTPGGFANWPIGPGLITVSYTTGDSNNPGIPPEIPADLKLAAIELINYYRNEEFRQSKTVMGTSVVNTLAQGTAFPQHIQVILDKYKYE